MDLFVDTANCISIAHFEFGEILVFSIESFFEIGNIFLGLLQFLELLIESFQFDSKICLNLSKYFKKFGMPIFIFPIIANKILIKEWEQYLIDIELEC